MRLEILALLIADCAAVVLVLLVARAIRFARASVAWPTHPARIVTAEAVDMWPLRGARWFSLYYRYRIAGREYVRTRYQFAHTWLTFGAIRRTAAELTANRDVAVYVDPADPGRATLRSGLHWTAYGLAVLSWLILAEVNLVFFLVRR